MCCVHQITAVYHSADAEELTLGMVGFHYTDPVQAATSSVNCSLCRNATDSEFLSLLLMIRCNRYHYYDRKFYRFGKK